MLSAKVASKSIGCVAQQSAAGPEVGGVVDLVRHRLNHRDPTVVADQVRMHEGHDRQASRPPDVGLGRCFSLSGTLFRRIGTTRLTAARLTTTIHPMPISFFDFRDGQGWEPINFDADDPNNYWDDNGVIQGPRRRPVQLRRDPQRRPGALDQGRDRVPMARTATGPRTHPAHAPPQRPPTHDHRGRHRDRRTPPEKPSPWAKTSSGSPKPESPTASPPDPKASSTSNPGTPHSPRSSTTGTTTPPGRARSPSHRHPLRRARCLAERPDIEHAFSLSSASRS